jgi:hypothetical protein
MARTDHDNVPQEIRERQIRLMNKVWDEMERMLGVPSWDEEQTKRFSAISEAVSWYEINAMFPMAPEKERAEKAEE